ncbi:MAG TPA: hypothetical protein GXX34_05805 [Clostridia bacterium]|nr:hypothetical protein [Clostridia bacterium]
MPAAFGRPAILFLSVWKAPVNTGMPVVFTGAFYFLPWMKLQAYEKRIKSFNLEILLRIFNLLQEENTKI